jgi:hypothetical protein
VAADPPKDRFLGFGCTGVLSEWDDPVKSGGSSLTDCMNLIYHRQGAWGRRPGATQSDLPSGNSGTPVSGYRWYRAFPSPLTKLVTFTPSSIGVEGQLNIGNDEFNLSQVGKFALSGSTPPMFCTARDPQAAFGNNGGADVLIIAGLVLPNGSFGTGGVTITGLPGTLPNGSWIQLTTTDTHSNTVTTAHYVITGADNPQSIALGLCQLINTTAAYLNGVNSATYNPWLGETYYTVPNPDQSTPTNPPNPQAIIHLGALSGGVGGNGITFGVTWNDTTDSGTTLAVYLNSGNTTTLVPNNNVTTTTTFSGGGNSWSGLCALDWNNGNPFVTGLSFMVPNAFTGCAYWHNHVWAWGDPNNPDTLFACDINQPEAWTFMIQNGGLNPKKGSAQTGGYDIGVGDGSPLIQTCVPLGNAFYVLKTDSIYMIEGYDFQQGEYQFSVTQQVVGYGIPSPYCATALDEQLVFWSGKKFLRLAVGAYEPEHIGLPIPITEGYCSTTMQPNVRAIAGDMQAKTLLNNVYVNGVTSTPATVIFRNLAIFSFDRGDGTFLNVVYDDEKSAATGGYAWTKWYGWSVGYWIRYGQGKAPSTANTDAPLIRFISPNGEHIYTAGGNAIQDFGSVPIPWMAQSGWIDGGTPELLKDTRVVYANASAVAGATLSATLIPGQIIVPQPNQQSQYGTQPMTLAFNPTFAPQYCEAINNLEQFVNTGQQAGQLPIQAKAFMVQWIEPGTANAPFELRSYGVDVIEESLKT